MIPWNLPGLSSKKKGILPVSSILYVAWSILTLGCSLKKPEVEKTQLPTVDGDFILVEATDVDTETHPGEGQQSLEKRVFIGPNRVDSEGSGSQSCYLVKETFDTERGFFYTEIAGFNWEEGYTYELSVLVAEKENPPADVSSLQYELKEIINQVPVESEYLVTYIEIITPAQGASVDPNKPINIEGMGVGLYEGNVVVQVETPEGTVIALDATTIDPPEAGIGGGGPWHIELELGGIVPFTGMITAFSPSQEDGSWMASDSVDVLFVPIEAESSPLEGPKWLLAGYADENLDSWLTLHRVTLNFDPVSMSLSGYSTCNSFSAAYDLDTQGMTLGPMVSTLMMCDDSRMVLEDALFKALAQVGGFRLTGKTLDLNDKDGKMALWFRVDPLDSAASFTYEELANMAYMCSFREDCEIKLTAGGYQESIEGSAASVIVQLSNHMAFGDINGDGVEEAFVVMVTHTGGSAVLYELLLVEKQNGELVNTARSLLGDRIILNDLSMEDGEIIATMIVAGPNDTMCCPGTPVTQRYRVESGELVQVK
jgi:heat shock protein HslJ